MYSVDIDKIRMPLCWKDVLREEFAKEYFSILKERYANALAQGAVIFPPSSLVFSAFSHTPFAELRVVILGQDPYHKKGEAMGLSFSVPRGIKIPPSLRTIYKELERSLGIAQAQHGDLTAWAKQGVFLLNASLTVEEGKANAHKNWGWHIFTDAVIQTISQYKEGVIFLLWGAFAREKKSLIDTQKHIVLESVHPSPLAGGGFIGNNHFSRVNALLEKKGMEPIVWELPQ